MIIRLALEIDSKDIYKLSRIVHFDKENFQSNGFLMANITEKQYKKFILNKAKIFVAEDNGEIVGYVHILNKEEYLKTNTHNLNKEIDYIYIKQIVALPGTGLNIGHNLYKYIKENFKINIYASVFSIPLNKRSLIFHDREDFIDTGAEEEISGNRVLKILRFEP